MPFRGVIIEESLEDKSILNEVKILRTEVEKVTSRHKTPWIKQWTKHTIVVPTKHAEAVTQRLASAIDYEHRGSWYADFKDNQIHYIIFRDRIFKINRKSKKQHNEANKFGEALGIPPYQLDFSPELE